VVFTVSVSSIALVPGVAGGFGVVRISMVSQAISRTPWIRVTPIFRALMVPRVEYIATGTRISRPSWVFRGAWTYPRDKWVLRIEYVATGTRISRIAWVSRPSWIFRGAWTYPRDKWVLRVEYVTTGTRISRIALVSRPPRIFRAWTYPGNKWVLNALVVFGIMIFGASWPTSSWANAMHLVFFSA
jgi:hypothetical protein